MTALWSLKYGIGSFSEPGVGFITFFAGAILALLALLLFFSSFREKGKTAGLRELWAGLDVKKVIYVLVLLVVYTTPAAFRRISSLHVHPSVSSSSASRVPTGYGPRCWSLSFVTAVSYLVFQVWLQVQLPRGILG